MVDGSHASAFALAAQGVTNGNSHDHNGGDGAAIPAGGLADGAVNTTAKLANDIVDDTKVGNRVPQFYRRQGGDPTNWDIPGVNDYTPGAVRMQGGCAQWTGSLASTGIKVVTFPVAFSAKPIVIVSVNGNYQITADMASCTTTTVTLEWRTNGAQQTNVEIFWFAIGTE